MSVSLPTLVSLPSPAGDLLLPKEGRKAPFLLSCKILFCGMKIKEETSHFLISLHIFPYNLPFCHH
jgi:hypothetical protein